MLWGRKTAALVRTIKEVPNAIGYAGRKSLSGLEEAGKFAKRTPGVLGQFGSLTAAAFGRVVKNESGPAFAAPARYVPHYEHIQRTRVPRAMIIFCVLFVLALATALIGWIHEAYRTMSITRLLLSPIFTIAFVSAIFWLWRQFRSWQSLVIVEQLQSDLSSPCETAAEQERFRTSFVRFRSKVSEPQLAEFLDSADVTADVTILQGDLDRIGLKGIDKNAVTLV